MLLVGEDTSLLEAKGCCDLVLDHGPIPDSGEKSVALEGIAPSRGVLVAEFKQVNVFSPHILPLVHGLRHCYVLELNGILIVN
jgi:hypothetical protein